MSGNCSDRSDFEVNNRKLNENFYIETLGMKPLLERVCLYFSKISQTATEIDFKSLQAYGEHAKVEGLKRS